MLNRNRFMRGIGLLFLAAIFVFSACEKDIIPTTQEDVETMFIENNKDFFAQKSFELTEIEEAIVEVYGNLPSTQTATLDLFTKLQYKARMPEIDTRNDTYALHGLTIASGVMTDDWITLFNGLPSSTEILRHRDRESSITSGTTRTELWKNGSRIDWTQVTSGVKTCGSDDVILEAEMALNPSGSYWFDPKIECD